jgi:hypothetical protein
LYAPDFDAYLTQVENRAVHSFAIGITCTKIIQRIRRGKISGTCSGIEQDTQEWCYFPVFVSDKQNPLFIAIEPLAHLAP